MALKKALSILDRLLLGRLVDLEVVLELEGSAGTTSEVSILGAAAAGEAATSLLSAWIWTFWAVTIVCFC